MIIKNVKGFSLINKFVKVQPEGFTLIELILVTALIGTLVFLVASLPNSIALMGRSQRIGVAREIASKQLEEKRELKYANISYGDQNVVDSRLNLLPKGLGTVSVKDCDLLVCTQGELAKEVSVTISWKENGKDQSVTIKTLVGQEGLN